MDREEALRLFTAWFVEPLQSLDVNGGFIAFMVSLALYERLIKAQIKRDGLKQKDELFQERMADDLGLTIEQQKIFWTMFRDGLLHKGMPKVDPKNDKHTRYIFHTKFPAIPRFVRYKDRNVICIDPTKFALRVLDEYVRDPELILLSETYSLASVGEIELDILLEMLDEN